jgi:hypothetical protein
MAHLHNISRTIRARELQHVDGLNGLAVLRRSLDDGAVIPTSRLIAWLTKRPNRPTPLSGLP